LVLMALTTVDTQAGILKFFHWRSECRDCAGGPVTSDFEMTEGQAGTWFWVRSAEQEKQVVTSLYNRYCIRCHGVDGRGIWDIPNVPDFTNARWQATRSDGQLTRAIMEGRGACMPPFRGTLTLEEGCAMGRYLRTFVPGTQASPPKVDQPKKDATKDTIPGKK
jgi:hypothetical protein